MLILTFNDSEEMAIKKVIAALTEDIKFEVLHSVTSSMLSFSGLEIRLHQRRVHRDGMEIRLTRLEYGILVFLASSPNRVFTQSQILEAVWSMDSNSCHSSVANVIYNLRKKIDPDSKNPTYLKTVLGIGYKLRADNMGNDGVFPVIPLVDMDYYFIRRCLGLVQSLIMIRLSLSCALSMLDLLKYNDTS